MDRSIPTRGWICKMMISETISTLPTRFAAQSTTFERYKQLGMTDADAHDLAIRFWDAGALGALEIARFIKEWREPRHSEFGQAPKTAWRLFNAATETIKGDLWRLPARTRVFHMVLDEICDRKISGNGHAKERTEMISTLVE